MAANTNELTNRTDERTTATERTTSCILERLRVRDWNAWRAGERSIEELLVVGDAKRHEIEKYHDGDLDLDDLLAKYRDEQTDLGRWSA